MMAKGCASLESPAWQTLVDSSWCDLADDRFGSQDTAFYGRAYALSHISAGQGG